MIMHIKAHLAQFQEHVAVQLDFKNAFLHPPPSDVFGGRVWAY